MFGWIEGIFHKAGSAVDSAVQALVHAAIRGLYGFLHSLFGNVIKAWENFYNAVVVLSVGQLNFIRAVYNTFVNLFKILLPHINNRITANNITINNRVTTVVKDYNTKITNESKARQAGILGLLLWIIAHVLRPLSALIAQIFVWIGKKGDAMWEFFTHLDKFAELLFWHLVAALEAHAWDIAKFLGEFFLALIVHNLVRFIKLMETILDAVI